jgi:hypothetical protein
MTVLKDYVLLAVALKNAYGAPIGNELSDADYELGWKAAVAALSNALAQDNPRFDRERFLKACGVLS